MFLYYVVEALHYYGFGNEVIGPEIHASDNVFLRIECGEDDYHDVRVASFSCFEGADHFFFFFYVESDVIYQQGLNFGVIYVCHIMQYYI